MTSTQKWDAIVIGAGLGGLTAAAYLTAAARGRLGAYVHSSTVKDPGGDYAPTGHSAVEVMVPFLPDHRAWGVDRGPHQGEDYNADPRYLEAKEAITEIMVDRAAEVMPGLREHVVYREAATPITQERYTLSTVEGAMLSGLHAAGAALHRDLAREIRDGLVLGDGSKLTGGGPGWDPLLASKRMSRKPGAAEMDKQEVIA